MKQRDLEHLTYTGLSYSKFSPSGHTTGNCSPDQTLKKPKYLSACDRKEFERGDGPRKVVYLHLNKKVESKRR